MNLNGYRPSDKSPNLEGLYERYHINVDAQKALEERILEKYGQQEPLTCEFGHEVYGHKTIDGWCCACEADVAFAESSLRATKPEIFK